MNSNDQTFDLSLFAQRLATNDESAYREFHDYFSNGLVRHFKQLGMTAAEAKEATTGAILHTALKIISLCGEERSLPKARPEDPQRSTTHELYGNLVMKKYAVGLSVEETREMERLRQLLDQQYAAFYAPVIQKLAAVEERLKSLSIPKSEQRKNGRLHTLSTRTKSKR